MPRRAERMGELSGVSVISLCSKGPVVFVGPQTFRYLPAPTTLLTVLLSSISTVTVTYLIDKIEWRRGLISVLGLAFGSVERHSGL